MKPKKRLKKRDPGYHIPLPFAMAIKRTLPLEDFERVTFKGMQLSLEKVGYFTHEIRILAHRWDKEFVLGKVPKRLVSRIEGLMEHEDRIVVSLENAQCDRLRHSFWICIDELPELGDLGL